MCQHDIMFWVSILGTTFGSLILAVLLIDLQQKRTFKRNRQEAWKAQSPEWRKHELDERVARGIPRERWMTSMVAADKVSSNIDNQKENV